MGWIGATVAVALIGVVFLDVFEALILPRRVRHGYRLSRTYYRSSWALWKRLALRFPPGPWRNGALAVFGPLSLFGLFTVWAVGLIAGFALVHWSLGTRLSGPPGTDERLTTYLYLSGTTFFTLGYGDVVPGGPIGRVLSVTEAGIGFGFLAVVIGYLPVFYQAFARREITIALLDARAGSPPCAGELFRRLADAGGLVGVGPLLADWERWSAELLESHLSFPVLRYFRSQHDNQSWVAALTAILDTSAVLIAAADSAIGHQARLTFAMARHAAVDLVLVTRTQLRPPEADRLPEADRTRLLEFLGRAGVTPRDGPAVTGALAELRGLYEPFVNAMAADLMLALPPFLPDRPPVDNWQTSPGMKRSPGLGDLPSAWHEHAD